MQAEPVISVVVPAHNDGKHLVRLLPTLVRGFAAHGLSSRIIVVANGGVEDGTPSICAEHGAMCLGYEHSLTPAAARNIGAASAAGDWLVFLDADVEPLDVWFATVHRLVKSGDPHLSAGWEVLVPTDAGWLSIAWQHVRMAAARTQRYINTGNLLIARPLFEKAGGFDAQRVAGEDAEFGERTLAAGANQIFDPGLAALHHGEPRGVGDFFRRQLFHAEPLREVLRAISSPLNIAIAAILATTILGCLSVLLLWPSARGYAVLMAMLGPSVLLLAAVAKAAAGWRTSIPVTEFGRMVAASAVMLAARTVGTVWQLRTWRT
jgi:hypothetical protein